MSMKKLAVIAAIHNYGGLNKTEMYPTPGSPPPPVHGVNVMLGGAMISGIILVIFIFCYCCHKTQKKSQTNLPPYWREPTAGHSMEIYTVENQSCYGSEDFAEAPHRPPTPGPPPAYETVVPIHKDLNWNKAGDETGLPSYETAVKLQTPGSGYV